MTVVTAHQPNLLPGCSVVTKILAADHVVWVDEVQFSHYSYTARNELANGTRVFVPVRSDSRHGPINRVEVAPDNGWRRKLARALRHAYGSLADPYCDEIERPYGLLVGLNAALLRVLLDDLRSTAMWHWQSQLLGGRRLDSITDDRATSGKRRQISGQLARMVAELGGDVYLSGPSGRGYLDLTPFEELGITVRFWEHLGPNPSALELVAISRDIELTPVLGEAS